MLYHSIVHTLNSKHWLRKASIHCEIFLSEHFMKYSFRGISGNMKYFHEILLLYYLKFIACVLINKKLCLQRKDVFSQRKFNSKNFDNILLIKQKQEKFRRPKHIWMKPWLLKKTGTTEVHVLTYFQKIC